jgi:transcriptional regulator with XRE-family HTH domain
MADADYLQKVALAHGSESYVAERVTGLRKEKGWSQDELARRVTAEGCPIPQSAISRLERPPSGGRRAVTVDEALAFARVFEVDLVELLLPPDAHDEIQFMEDLREGPKRLLHATAARSAYDETLLRVAAKLRESDEWRHRVTEGLDTVTESLGVLTDNALREQTARQEFLTNVLEAAGTKPQGGSGS